MLRRGMLAGSLLAVAVAPAAQAGPLRTIKNAVPVAPSLAMVAGAPGCSQQETFDGGRHTSTTTCAHGPVSCVEHNESILSSRVSRTSSTRCTLGAGDTAAEAGCSESEFGGGGAYSTTDDCFAGPVSYSERDVDPGTGTTSRFGVAVGDVAIGCTTTPANQVPTCVTR